PRARPAARRRGPLRRRRHLPGHLQRAALLAPRLALPAPGRAPVRARRRGAHRPRDAEAAGRRRDPRRAGRAGGAQRPGRGGADVGAPGVGPRAVPADARAVVARVVALVPDLLFGSRVLEALRAAGHEVTLTGDEDEARSEIEFADVLVV